MRAHINTDFARSLDFAPKGKQLQYRDTKLRGFYINAGSMTHTYMVQADCKDALGRKRTIRRKVGDVQLMDADDARNTARKLIASIKAGEFTNTNKPHEVTLREAWDHFQASRGQGLSKQTLDSYRKSLEKVLGDLLDTPLKTLAETAAARKEIAARHELETNRRGPYMANRAFQNLRAIYNHARKGFDSIPDMPPTALVRWNKEYRYQVGDVLTEFWAAQATIDHPVRRAFFAVLLLSGSRPGALARLKWSEVDVERQTAFIAKPKGGENRAFEMILSKPIIEYMEAARFDDEFVFFGMRSQNSYREPSMPVPAGKLRNVYMAVAKSIGVEDLLLKLLVNHKVTDVTHGYAAQRSVLLPMLIAEQGRVTDALLLKN